MPPAEETIDIDHITGDICAQDNPKSQRKAQDQSGLKGCFLLVFMQVRGSLVILQILDICCCSGCVNGCDEYQPGPGRPGCFVFLLFFLKAFMVFRLPVPQISNLFSRHTVGLFQTQVFEAGPSRALSAVTSQARKYRDEILLRSGFTVILDMLPFTAGIIKLLTECIDSFNAQVCAASVLNPVCQDIPAEAVKRIGLNFNCLCKTCVIASDIPDLDRVRILDICHAEYCKPRFHHIGVSIPEIRISFFIKFLKIGIDQQVFGKAERKRHHHQDDHSDQEPSEYSEVSQTTDLPFFGKSKSDPSLLDH